MTAVSVVRNVTEKANSFEFGKPGMRHKLYYEDLSDLRDKITTARDGEMFLESLKPKEPEGDENRH